MRNFIDCRDPIPPVVNFYLNHPDPIFTRAGSLDSWIYTSAMSTETKPLHLLLLPFLSFTHPDSVNFAEFGVNAMILCLYGPILFLLGLPYLRKRRPPSKAITYVSASVVYLVLPWLFSSLGRYFLHWYPVLAAWVGIVISRIYARAMATWHLPWQMGITRLATAMFCWSLLFPTPSRLSVQFYKGYYGMIVSLFRSGYDLQAYLRQSLLGYSAGQAVIATLLSNQKSDTKVLLFPEVGKLAFYFRKAKIISVGDYFGPARYGDLGGSIGDYFGLRGDFFGISRYVDPGRRIQAGDRLPYLTRFNISAIIIEPRRRSLFYDKFRAQLTGDGFNEYRCPEGDLAIFLRSDIHPDTQLIPVSH
jgi:hypothetical protein